ncbi:MAG: fimbria/pilus outer membrane usher protein [Rudaea sp.]
MVFACLATNSSDAATTGVVGLDASADPGGTGGADGNALYLDVVVNGAAKGLVRFSGRDGEIYASASILAKLGFVLPVGTPDPIRLTSLPGAQTKYDAARQSVTIDAPLQLLDLPKTVLNAPPNAVPKVTTSPGMLLNYDVYATLGEHDTSSVNTFTELRAFNRLGVLSSTSLAQSTYTGATGWQRRFERLDTTWTSSFPDDMLALRIGDVLTDALAWSRGTRVGGVQFGTDFALQPYRVTTPLPAFFGSATLPSDVQLYINGMKQYSGAVPAGPFQLTTIPNINGAGNAQLVVTDALGRATTLNFSLYNTQQLLAQGLSDWSAELGVVRENYGLNSFDYGHDPVGSATWRHGVSDSFTAEAHAEATAGLVEAGAGGSWLLGQAGVFSAAFARSANRGQGGSLLSLGYDWRGDRFNFGLGGTRAQGDYADVATLYGSPPPRVSAHAQIGYNADALGSFNIGYVHLRSVDQPASRYASANWFKSVGRTGSLSLSVNQNLDSSNDRSFFLSFTFALNGKTTLSTGVTRDHGRDSAVVDINHATPSEGGIGWRADLRAGDQQNGGQAELDYLGRYGRIATGVNALGDSRFAYADLSGALVYMEGHVFAARQIDNAFALVSTDGIGGVPVKLENRPIGTTDANGLLLVTPLNAYQNNQVAIDPMQLPADTRIDRVRALATPGDRSGALVRFGITPIRAASIVLVDAANDPLPLGSEVLVSGKAGEPALVGFDGVVYLDTLDEHNLLDVETKSGKCHVRFDFHRSGDGIPQIGPLVCRSEQP